VKTKKPKKEKENLRMNLKRKNNRKTQTMAILGVENI
jgi:hypothetical protein